MPDDRRQSWRIQDRLNPGNDAMVVNPKSRRATKTMRAVVQRVKRAEVRVGEEVVGRIGHGLVILLGVGRQDTEAAGEALAEKIVHLRVFDDTGGKMNLSLLEARGQALCISQFTLYGDCRKGRRPGYDHAAPPDSALPLYEKFVNSLRARGIPTETGRFRAMMDVELVNDGPVTLLLDSDRQF
jgi:D-tyrosyl-tRNA(Tyr) deacylase